MTSNSANLLTELVSKIELPQYALPLENEILDENSRINRACLNDWKEKIESLVRDLCIKWIDRDVRLDDIMKEWAFSFEADPELLKKFEKLGQIIENWKIQLRQIFFKDTSIYTMPPNVNFSEEIEQNREVSKEIDPEKKNVSQDDDDEEESEISEGE